MTTERDLNLLSNPDETSEDRGPLIEDAELDKAKEMVEENTSDTPASSDDVLAFLASEDKYEIIEELIIPSMTTSNTTKHTGVTEPADWVGNKYKFDGSDWTKNTDFKIVCTNKCRTEDSIVTLNNYNATTCTACGESL